VRRSTLALALTAICLGGFVAIVDGRSQRISFRTDDGVTIAATWYEPSTRPAPAVILVHMLNRTRRDWDSFAARLASSGIGALAIDLRGHGESNQPQADPATSDYASMVRDLLGARRYLASRADVIPSRIGLVGASLGANLVALAGADGSFASLALLSPSLDYRGLRIEAAIKKYGKRPLLLVVSDDDAYARRSAVDLQKANGAAEVLMLNAAGHGTRMFDRAPDLPQALIDFLRRTVQ
jgi:alpha-beta hydrolase superfamily lysophospholipase